MSIARIPAPIRLQVEDAVRGEILAGVVVSGERLVERDLCARFEVSRPVIREALRQLEAEGLLTHGKNGGVSVAVLQVDEVQQIYDVRCLLEPFAARQFIQHASEAQRAALTEAVVQLEKGIAANDTVFAIHGKNAFYRVMAEGCGNPVLEQTLWTLQNRIQLLRGASMSVPGRLKNTAREVRAIFDAILSGDPEAADAACREHLLQAAETTRLALLARASSCPSRVA